MDMWVSSNISIKSSAAVGILSWLLTLDRLFLWRKLSISVEKRNHKLN